MNKDQVKGLVKRVKGKAKIAVGKAVGNKELELKGRAQDAIGKAQTGYGDVKEEVKKNL